MMQGAYGEKGTIRVCLVRCRTQTVVIPYTFGWKTGDGFVFKDLFFKQLHFLARSLKKMPFKQDAYVQQLSKVRHTTS
jgi:hypothetical protein